MTTPDSKNPQFPHAGSGPLVAPELLAQHLDDPNVLIVDSRADIRDATKGRTDYEASHIRNAVFADLDVDLSGLTQKGALGRHPLPTDAALSAHTAPSLHLHLCCALPAARNLEYFHDHALLEPLLFDGVAVPANGELRPDLSRPGLGLTLKRVDAARYEV